LLADRWARARGGSVLALVVDHGLRTESGAEADLTVTRLSARGIAAEKLVLHGLLRGSALAARARVARHAALAEACRRRGILHLLLGHHAADQAETLEMRAASGTGADGRAGMAVLRETDAVRILRPLLTVPPGPLRRLLLEVGMEWVEDPSNADPASLRARLRLSRVDPSGEGPSVAAAVETAARNGRLRARREREAAQDLAERVRIMPEGYAVLSPGPLSAAALGALLRVIGGAQYAPANAALQRLAADPCAATLGGVRLMPAGRHGPTGAVLVVREARAMAGPVPAVAGAYWDSRFRLLDSMPDATLGAVGTDSVALRRRSDLPAAVLTTLPAIRVEGRMVVPHLDGARSVVFAPPVPLACATFCPA
jgi:tRNA(Ile)-lysidine synthase